MRSTWQKSSGIARRQARRARQEPDAQRFGREIRVFPALAQTYTKNDDTSDLDAGVGESVGFVERSECGAEQITQSRHWARSGQLCPPSEDLEDLERNRRNDSDVGAAERLSILERKKRAVLNSSAEPIPCLRRAFMTD